jgi:hypothetical protein
VSSTNEQVPDPEVPAKAWTRRYFASYKARRHCCIERSQVIRGCPEFRGTWDILSASASPPRGVTGTILTQATVGGKDYILREITVQPGRSTGWHYHDGTLYALVKEGTLTRTQSDCTTNETCGADRARAGRSAAGPSAAETPASRGVVQRW